MELFHLYDKAIRRPKETGRGFRLKTRGFPFHPKHRR
jgi:hypothetical protein